MANQELVPGYSVLKFDISTSVKDGLGIGAIIAKAMTESNFKSAIKDEVILYVTEDNTDGAVVAVLCFNKDTITNLYVLPEHRLKGIGLVLVNLAKSFLKEGSPLIISYPSKVEGMRTFLSKAGITENTLAPQNGINGERMTVVTQFSFRVVPPEPELQTKPTKKRRVKRVLPEAIRIDHITRDNNANLVKSFEQLFSFFKGRPYVERELNDSEVYVAYNVNNDVCVGFVCVNRTYAGKQISDVYVTPGVRSLGIASLLIETVVMFGTMHDTTYVQLHKEDNASLELFKSVGFNFPPTVGDYIAGNLNGAGLKTLEELEEDYQTICKARNHVYWNGPKEVTLDGYFDLKELKALVRYIENGGPEDGRGDHEE